MKQELTSQEAYNWAAERCSRGEHCRHDIGEKLRQRGLADAACQEVLDRLEDEGFINEERYCRAFAHDKFLFDKWGRLKIREALRLRRISGAGVEEILNEAIDEEQYRQHLEELLLRKRATLHDDDVRVVYQKLVRHAASRGYEPAAIFEAIKRIDIPEE